MTVIYDRQAELMRWALDRLAQTPYGTPDGTYLTDARALGQERQGRLVAVVVFDAWQKNNVDVHIASDGSGRWLTREFLIRCAALPFIQCGIPRVSARIAETNAPAIAFARQMGGVEEGRQRRAGPNGEDMILFGALRHECPWINRPLFRRVG